MNAGKDFTVAEKLSSKISMANCKTYTGVRKR